MNTKAWVLALVAAVIIGFGAWWYVAQAPTTSTSPEATGTDQGMQDNGVATVDISISTALASATVTYGPEGFSPAEVTVRVGGTVTWTNNSGGSMWVASAQHPAHTAYAGTTLAQHCADAVDVSFDQCKNSDTYSFTFDKAGTWAYHNHSNASYFGKVTVVE